MHALPQMQAAAHSLVQSHRLVDVRGLCEEEGGVQVAHEQGGQWGSGVAEER